MGCRPASSRPVTALSEWRVIRPKQRRDSAEGRRFVLTRVRFDSAARQSRTTVMGARRIFRNSQSYLITVVSNLPA
jgi:hypothetical protein